MAPAPDAAAAAAAAAANLTAAEYRNTNNQRRCPIVRTTVVGFPGGRVFQRHGAPPHLLGPAAASLGLGAATDIGTGLGVAGAGTCACLRATHAAARERGLTCRFATAEAAELARRVLTREDPHALTPATNPVPSLSLIHI